MGENGPVPMPNQYSRSKKGVALTSLSPFPRLTALTDTSILNPVNFFVLFPLKWCSIDRADSLQFLDDDRWYGWDL
jgi:hypothetical protein